VNHRDEVLRADPSVIDAAQEIQDVLGAAKLRALLLDLARRKLGRGLHGDAVNNGVEELLARAVLAADGDPDDLAGAILVAPVTEPDGGGLPALLEHIGVGFGVEVDGEYGVRPPRQACDQRLAHYRLGVGACQARVTQLAAQLRLENIPSPLEGEG